MKDDKFGFTANSKYEEKLVCNLLNDDKFLFDIGEIIKSKYFEKAYLSLVVDLILKYYQQYYKTPTYEYFLIQFSEMAEEGTTNAIVNASMSFIGKFYEKRGFKEKLLVDREEIQKHARSFCTTKEYVLAVEQCVDLLGTDRQAEIADIITRAEIKSAKKNIRIDYDDIDRRKEDKPRRNIVPLPFEFVNETIGGGIGAGEVMALIGPMGTGKSTITQNVSLNAKKEGYNTVIYTMELSGEFTRYKMDNILLKKPIKDINEHIEEIEKINKEYKGKAFITRLPATSTIFDIQRDLRQINALGHKIDMVIIDYIDLMNSINSIYNSKDEWVKFGEITKELRDELAQVEDIAVLALCQGNTSSIEETIIRASSAGGGAKRLFPADVVAGYARTNALKAIDKSNFSIIKNRFGKDGVYFEFDTDYSIGKIVNSAPYKPIALEEEEVKKDVREFIVNDFLPKQQKQQSKQKESNSKKDRLYD